MNRLIDKAAVEARAIEFMRENLEQTNTPYTTIRMCPEDQQWHHPPRDVLGRLSTYILWVQYTDDNQARAVMYHAKTDTFDPNPVG